MSLLTSNGRISVKPFAEIPPLGSLPAILSECASLSSAISSNDGVQTVQQAVNLSEGCMVTKSVKYTHQLVHWINSACKGDPREVETLLNELRIIPYSNFMLNDPCNLAFLEPFVYTSLNLYAFVAVAPSISTLEDLVVMVRADNAKRQELLDKGGLCPKRSLNFSHASIMDPEYELVVLYPEHFLPVWSVLPIYDPLAGTHKFYVPAEDRRLRESTQTNSPQLPAFRHTLEKRDPISHVNVFLITMNAEIKFRRYFKEIQLQPPKAPLPDDVLSLMRLTQELIELIYWEAKPTKGSEGESILADFVALQNQSALPDIASENSFGMAFVEDVPNASQCDLETRMAYAMALIESYARDHDPDLFEPQSPL